MLMPQSITQIDIDIAEGESQIVDLKLPQDRLISNYRIEFKEPWQEATSSVEFIGVI